ncbi:MAG: hypothetical protein EOP54_23270 [Sphingobacteriales bacterium]|nr:MAG: hypothetical protein EOP54_23270 [Sphingobacteriales bacterium]
MILLYAIYATALFFWLRYIYRNSFRKREDFIYFTGKLFRLLVLLPLGLQALMLFIVGITQLPQLAAHFSSFVLGREKSFALLLSNGWYPLFIICIGSAGISINYVLMKIAATNGYPFTRQLLTGLLWLAGLASARILLPNVLLSVDLFTRRSLVFDYNNSFLFSMAIFLLLSLSLLKHRYAKYFALNLYVLLLYGLAILLLALPLIICGWIPSKV